MTAVRSEINVTPLVDVCLVLLVTFMVVTPLLNGDGVQIPRVPRPSAEPREKGDLVLTLRADSPGCGVDGDSVAMEAVGARLSELHDREPTRKIRLRADERLEWKRVREAMQAAAESGYRELGLIAERKEQGR